jgi:hypothetical protein
LQGPSTTTANTLFIGADQNAAQANSRLTFGTDGQALVTLLENGFLGVGTTTPQTNLHVVGAVRATAFEGSGAGLANLNAGGLSGTVADARLSGNVALLSGAPTFAGAVTAPSFSGSGAGLTALNAARLSSGTVPDARLGGNVARTNQVWLLGGNSGTTPGVQFLGTTDDQPVELRVGGMRALRLENNGDGSDPGSDPDGAPNVVAGSQQNTVGAGVVGATISGGGATNYGGVMAPNTVLADYAALGGGLGNAILGASEAATIAGGQKNAIGTNAHFSAIGGGHGNSIAANSAYSTIAGGYGNSVHPSSSGVTISGGYTNTIAGAAWYGTIAGGESNNIGTNSDHSVIGGGFGNDIGVSSWFATIPGGRRNSATNYAFAAGRQAKARHTGAFVWADSQAVDFASTASNQFLIRASGGMGINTNNLHGAALSVNGTVRATGFSGSGAGLTGLNASNLTGALSDAVLSSNLTFAGLVNFTSSQGLGIGTTNTPRAGLDITATKPFVGSAVLFQVQDGTGAYTNLRSARCVAVSGNLLAVGALEDGAVTIVDISNPYSPAIRSQFHDDDGVFSSLGGVHGLAFSGNIMAIAAYQESAVTLVSVNAGGVATKLVELRDGVNGWHELSGSADVAISGNLLAIASIDDSAVTLADISTPSSPVLRSVLKDGQLGFNHLLHAEAVALSGNLLAIASPYDQAVTLVDVSNPANPVKRAELVNGTGSYTNLFSPVCLALSGGLLAIGSFVDEAVTLVDVSNPASPVWRSVLIDGRDGISALRQPYKVALSENRLAVSAVSSDAVTLFDVSNPAQPRWLAAAKDKVSGVNFLNGPIGLTFVGENVAVAAIGSSAFTLLGWPDAAAALVSQGWVGIGTAHPLAPLHVAGNVVVEGGLFDINASRVELGDGTATGDRSTAMGSGTTASGYSSTAMGAGTTASGYVSTALGSDTTASGHSSTAMGLRANASGDISIAMGTESVASGNRSMAAGTHAHAIHDGAFVWSDLHWDDFASTAVNQFLVRAEGGMGINKNNPATALDVNGTVTATSFSGSGAGLTGLPTAGLADNSVTSGKLANDSGSLSKVTAGKMTVSGGRLSLADDQYLNDRDIRLRNDAFHGLGWYGSGKLYAGVNLDGPVLYGNIGGGLGTAGGSANLALRWNGAGNVMIDPRGLNSGTLVPGVTFGDSSGEGIASKRTSGGNRYGLDLYTRICPPLEHRQRGPGRHWHHISFGQHPGRPR